MPGGGLGGKVGRFWMDRRAAFDAGRLIFGSAFGDAQVDHLFRAVGAFARFRVQFSGWGRRRCAALW